MHKDVKDVPDFVLATVDVVDGCTKPGMCFRAFWHLHKTEYQVVLKLSRKEQVIGENWDVDIAIPMPPTTIFARSILWKNLGTMDLRQTQLNIERKLQHVKTIQISKVPENMCKRIYSNYITNVCKSIFRYEATCCVSRAR